MLYIHKEGMLPRPGKGIRLFHYAGDQRLSGIWFASGNSRWGVRWNRPHGLKPMWYFGKYKTRVA